MPSLNTISNWFKYSQIEYFTPFMKLWLAFNSWYKQFLPNLHTDREAINSIKLSGSIKDSFEYIIETTSDQGRELKEAISILVKELRIHKLFDGSSNSIGFDQSDIEPNFRNLSTQSKNKKLRSGNFIKLDEETVVTSDKSILFQETLEVIYQTRCCLIHGDFDVDNQRAHRLIKNSFIILNKIFGPIVLNTQ